MMRLALFALSGAAALCLGSAARSLTYTPQAESIPKMLTSPGSEAIVANCSGCHSLDYIATQPPGKGAQFWRDAVNKMMTVYGAPIAVGDVDGLATELESRFGKASG